LPRLVPLGRGGPFITQAPELSLKGWTRNVTQSEHQNALQHPYPTAPIYQCSFGFVQTIKGFGNSDFDRFILLWFRVLPL